MFSVITKPLWRIKDRLKRTRYFTYIFVSIWKILCFFVFTLLAIGYRGDNIPKFFSSFSSGFSAHKIRITEVKLTKRLSGMRYTSGGRFQVLLREKSGRFLVTRGSIEYAPQWTGVSFQQKFCKRLCLVKWHVGNML